MPVTHSMDYFPFERLGLRRNPFSAMDQAEWSDHAWLHPQLEGSLESQISIIQILGDPGTGKTSALLALNRELEQRGRKVNYVYLHPDRRQPMLSLDRYGVLLVDEIERLSTRKRRRLFRTAISRPGVGIRLGFSSHLDLRQELPAHELDRLWTLTFPSIDSTQLEMLLNDRIRSAAHSENLPVWITQTAAEVLLDRYLGDLRKVERVLYEVFQALDEKGPMDQGRIKLMLDVIGESTEPG